MRGLQQRGRMQDWLRFVTTYLHWRRFRFLDEGSTACTCTFYGPDEVSTGQQSSRSGCNWFEDGRLRLAVANAGDSRAVLGRKELAVAKSWINETISTGMFM